MDAVLSLERFELLYDAGLVSEAQRDKGDEQSDAHGMGDSLISDHRRILATALGRLRGKLAYRPVVFELLPGEFTLLQLQRVVEALSGAKLHKQNFRRLVSNADLVEPIARTSAIGKGRPAELFRFGREVRGEGDNAHRVPERARYSPTLAGTWAMLSSITSRCPDRPWSVSRRT